MSAPLPSPHEAADLLGTVDRVHARVRGAASWRYVGWLSGMAVATVMYLAAMGLVGSDTEVLVLSIPFAVCVAGLSVTLLPGSRVSSTGFARRWITALVSWGVLYAASLVIGLSFFRGVVAFWLPAAIVTALPLVLGARAEARA